MELGRISWGLVTNVGFFQSAKTDYHNTKLWFCLESSYVRPVKSSGTSKIHFGFGIATMFGAVVYKNLTIRYNTTDFGKP